MSTVVIGVDINKSPSEDLAFQDAVAKVLKNAGHTVEKLERDPNAFATYSYENKAKGKIGIYLIAAGTYSIADFYYGAASGGGSFKYAYFGIRGDLSVRPHSQSEFESVTVGADADCPESLCAHIAGKTFTNINTQLKDKCQAIFGKTGEEMGKNILNAMGGGTDSSENKNSGSGSSAKECIQKLLTHWDGDVECRIRGKKVYINKIREPKSNYSLILKEGLNVYSDSISITDLNPGTVNHLIVKWTGGTIELKDDQLIKRFGEVKKEVEAVKKIVKTVNETKTTSSSTDTDTVDTTTDTDIDTETTDTGTDTTTDDTSTTETKQNVVEEKITNYKDALAFANTEWNKIKRDNGHTIECQTRGSSRWKVGEWVRVIFPSFDENGFMYISRTSQSDDGGDWNCNISLVDYPPGWGKEQLEGDNKNSDEKSDSGDISKVVDEICNEIGKFSYASGCSDAECIKASGKGECWALSDYVYKRLKGAGIKAKIHQYATSSAGNHRQVSYYNGSSWVMFPYSKSGIDHYFYTNEIPSDTEIIAS